MYFISARYLNKLRLLYKFHRVQTNCVQVNLSKVPDDMDLYESEGRAVQSTCG